MASSQPISMPVIVHHSLSKSPIVSCLAQHKVRVSETSSERSIIFPMSSVAFFYLPLTPAVLATLDSPQQRASLLHSVTKFVEVHCHCYVVMVTNDLTDKAFDLIGELQTRQLASRLQVIPVHTAAEAAAAMVDVAKLQCRPLAGTMHGRFCVLMNKLLLEDTFPRLLAQLGLDSHHQQLVQDGIGCLSKLATASTADLMDCALDRDTAISLTSFFNPDQ